MFLSSRNKKRILIFLVILLLTVIPLISEDFTLKLISTIILVIYVAFIIFLRDSVKLNNIFDEEQEEEYPIDISERADIENQTSFETDHGEGFEIISKTKNAEIITSQNYDVVGSQKIKTGISKEELKEHFTKIIEEEIPNDVGSDQQFVFVLEKILNVIKEAYLAHTVVFFWYNDAKQHLSVQKYFSNTTDAITKKHFPLEDDIISKIVHTEEPVHLSEIPPNAELDVIRYYDKPQGIRSFVGVPLFYGKSLNGVLVVDAKVPDAFGIETVYSLGRFVRIIAIIISLFEEKFSSSNSENRLDTLLNILKTDKKFDTEEDILSTINNSIKNLVHWDAFSFIYYNPTEQKFIVTETENNTSEEYFEEGTEIELEDTLVGKAILSGVPVNIEDMNNEKYKRIRTDEPENMEGSFLALPLVYDNQTFGVLAFENMKKKIYSISDVKFMKSAVKILSFFVYSYSTQTVLKNLLSVDVETKALTYNAFVEQANSDLAKSNEVNVPGALALIQIDEFLEERSLFETDPFPKVLATINQIIKNEISALALLGRVGEKLFAVYFFNSTTKDVFLWAEKLRIKIARKPISVLSKQNTFTVSIGVASANQKNDIEEVLKNAELALNKALEKGGNTVKSIN